jgi:hypothetical protein
MSAHVEYWGIPSPTEELYCAQETHIPLDKCKIALAGSTRFFVQNIECCKEGADSIRKCSNMSVPFSKAGMAMAG